MAENEETPWSTAIASTINGENLNGENLNEENLNDTTLKDCARLCNYLYRSKQDRLEARERGLLSGFEASLDETDDYMVIPKDFTIFLAWRGTSNLRDIVDDLVFENNKISLATAVVRGIEVQNKFYDRCQNNVSHFAQRIVAKIRELENDENEAIKNIVFTGHSLGGALAELAHLMIKARLRSENLGRKIDENRISLHTVAFSAPMSISFPRGINNADNADFAAAVNYLRENIAPNSFNITYGMDVVPHGYSNATFINAFLDDLRNRVPGLFDVRGVNDIIDLFAGRGFPDVLNFILNIQPESFPHYCHVGKIIHVRSENQNQTNNIYSYVDCSGNLHGNGFDDFREKVVYDRMDNDIQAANHVMNEHMKILRLIDPEGFPF